MKHNLLKIKIIICAVLVILFSLEWFYDFYYKSGADFDNRHSFDSKEYSLPDVDADNLTVERYSYIVDKPLFDESRRPPPKVVETVSKVEYFQINDWILVGIIRTKSTYQAMFTKRGDPKSFIKITVNQLISGWTVKEINPGYVVLQLNDQKKTIELRKSSQHASSVTEEQNQSSQLVDVPVKR